MLVSRAQFEHLNRPFKNKLLLESNICMSALSGLWLNICFDIFSNDKLPKNYFEGY